MASVAAKTITVIESGGRQSESFGWGFNVYAALHGMYGVTMALLGDLQRAASLCEKGLRIAQEMNDLYCLGHNESVYAQACIVGGDGRKTITHAEKALRYFEETQFLTMMGSAHYALGYGHYLLGDLRTAREHAEKGLESDRAVGYFMLLYHYYQLMAGIHLDLSDWESARRCAEDGLKETQAQGQKLGEGMLSIYLGIALARVDLSQAALGEGYILKGINSFDELGLKPLSATGNLLAGGLYADTGQKDKALATLKKTQAMFQEMGMDYWLARTEKALEKLEA